MQSPALSGVSLNHWVGHPSRVQTPETSHTLQQAPSMRRVSREALAALARAGQTRNYSPVEKVLKKVQEAAERAKAAAEEAAKGASAAEQLARARQSAAAAASSLGEKVQQATSSAQQLASATVEELLKQNAKGADGKQEQPAAGAACSSTSGQQQEGQQAASAEAGTQEQQGQEQEQQQRRQEEAAAGKRSILQRLRSFAASAGQEMLRAVRAEDAPASALRGRAEKAGDIQTSTTSELMVSATQQSGWQKQWGDMRDKLGSHPLFQRMRGISESKMFERGRELGESLRDRWETSDSPLVHRIQDATDSLFTESEQARALREIRARDPSFDMVDFLRHLRRDVPLIIKAYLEGQEDVIQQHCSPEMVERLTGIMRAQRQQGLIPDPTLLDTSEVELVDLKMLEEEPIVVVQFTCQQINCTRDNFGNVVEGQPDEVHRVYYYWALQQEPEGYVGTDGAYHPPRWQLRELLIRGMHHLL